MKELGLDGSSLGALVQGAAKATDGATPDAAPFELSETPEASDDVSDAEAEPAAE